MNTTKESNNNLKRNVASFLLIIFLIGLVLLFTSFFIAESSGIWLSGLKKLLSTLGQTLIGSCIVSIIFSIKDIRETLLDLIREIVMHHNYLKNLRNEQVESIHDCCHQILDYSNINLNEKEWNLLRKQSVNVFKIPFCTDWRENIDCKIVDNEICKKIRLSFTLINPIKDGKNVANLVRRLSTYIPPNKNKNEYIKIDSFDLLIDGIKHDVIPKIEFIDENYKNYNVLAKIISDSISLNNVEFENKLEVTMVYNIKQQIDDLSYTNRLRYPTSNFRLDFTCNDKRVKMTPQFFGAFIEKKQFEIMMGENHSFIECKNNLILQGGGAVIVLCIDNNEKERKNKKIKNFKN